MDAKFEHICIHAKVKIELGVFGAEKRKLKYLLNGRIYRRLFGAWLSDDINCANPQFES